MDEFVKNDTELYHYGVLGMKWGVRKARRGSASKAPKPSKSEKREARINSKAKKNNWSDDAKSAALLKGKKPSQMSNAELKKLNERLQLEKTYSQLNSKDKSAGKKFVMGVLNESAKQTASKYVSKYMSQGVEKLIGQAVQTKKE